MQNNYLFNTYVWVPPSKIIVQYNQGGAQSDISAKIPPDDSDTWSGLENTSQVLLRHSYIDIQMNTHTNTHTQLLITEVFYSVSATSSFLLSNYVIPSCVITSNIGLSYIICFLLHSCLSPNIPQPPQDYIYGSLLLKCYFLVICNHPPFLHPTFFWFCMIPKT